MLFPWNMTKFKLFFAFQCKLCLRTFNFFLPPMFYKDNGSGLLKCRELVINIWNSHQFSNIDDNSFLSSPLWKQIPQCGKIWWLAHKWYESVECPKKGSTFCSISSTKVKPKDSSDVDPEACNKPTKGRHLGRWPWTRAQVGMPTNNQVQWHEDLCGSAIMTTSTEEENSRRSSSLRIH